ncbi:MAG: hypothetical protein C0595_10125 [Marinilabiliales bacterium]|nr:MAG: hypothetical protein C0595_10125 [Marinilabiliales bacterium]
MATLYYVSIIIFSFSILGFFFIMRKKSHWNNLLQIEQKSVDENIKELNSPDNNFERRYQSEYVAIKSDIKQTESNILNLKTANKKEEEANYMKNVFLTNVSNEIRNPLNGILGFANLLKTEMAQLNRDDLYEFSDNISQSGESLLKILNDIIDISSIEAEDISFNLVPCNLKEIINTSIENYKKVAHDKGIEIISDNDFNYSVLSDKETLYRILNSVIDNSVRFTDRGYVRISISNDNGNITIKIKDTGVGIDTSYIPMVFEPYRRENLGYSTKYQGAGLSLPLAKKALNVMKNDINIESQKGLGTTVIINLIETADQNIEKPKDEKPKSKSSNSPWYKKNILLVEDDKINQILFTKLLVGCNNLIICASGEETLDKLTELVIDQFNIDFVLMDINLPGKYDGIKLMHKIKKEWSIFKNKPFIAQTAYAMSNEREKFIDEGFDEYLSKPIKKTELENVVEKVLNL